jgi:hypothetical protein
MEAMGNGSSPRRSSQHEVAIKLGVSSFSTLANWKRKVDERSFENRLVLPLATASGLWLYQRRFVSQAAGKRRITDLPQ